MKDNGADQLAELPAGVEPEQLDEHDPNRTSCSGEDGDPGELAAVGGYADDDDQGEQLAPEGGQP